MAVTSLTRFNGGSRDAFVAVAKKAKAIFEKSGAEFRASQIYSGPHVGQWVASLRFSDWEAYGNAMNALAKDAAYQTMMAEVEAISQVADRTFLVDIDF